MQHTILDHSLDAPRELENLFLQRQTMRYVCNGVFFLWDRLSGRPHRLTLCNPTTKEYSVLPSPNLNPSPEGAVWRILCCGFGFVHRTKEFMVVAISGPKSWLPSAVQV
ncbi:hypothetical protein Droror1_Dr00009914 [Drosera rotundifolia]